MVLGMRPQPDRPDAASGMIRSWHPYEAAPEDHEFLQELAEVVRYPTTALGPTKAELEVRVAELRSLLKAAQRGELRNRQWDVVRRHPDLWEAAGLGTPRPRSASTSTSQGDDRGRPSPRTCM